MLWKKRTQNWYQLSGSEKPYKFDTSSKPPQPCHTGWVDIPVGGVVLHLGGRTRGARLDEAQGGLLVDLTGSYKPSVLTYGVSERLLISRPAVVVDWEDFSLPPTQIGRDWWEILAEEARRYKDVWIRCDGGHGRTGTAAAILAYLLDSKEVGDDPVEFIRQHYCGQAVETQAQIDYVAAITGTLTTAASRLEHVIEILWGGD
jgi:hypothetical protein